MNEEFIAALAKYSEGYSAQKSETERDQAEKLKFLRTMSVMAQAASQNSALASALALIFQTSTASDKFRSNTHASIFITSAAETLYSSVASDTLKSSLSVDAFKQLTTVQKAEVAQLLLDENETDQTRLEKFKVILRKPASDKRLSDSELVARRHDLVYAAEKSTNNSATLQPSSPSSSRAFK